MSRELLIDVDNNWDCIFSYSDLVYSAQISKFRLGQSQAQNTITKQPPYPVQSSIQAQPQNRTDPVTAIVIVIRDQK